MVPDSSIDLAQHPNQRHQPYRRRAYYRLGSEAIPHKLVGGEPVKNQSPQGKLRLEPLVSCELSGRPGSGPRWQSTKQSHWMQRATKLMPADWLH